MPDRMDCEGGWYDVALRELRAAIATEVWAEVPAPTGERVEVEGAPGEPVK